jgi:hypothetical protein
VVAKRLISRGPKDRYPASRIDCLRRDLPTVAAISADETVRYPITPKYPGSEHMDDLAAGF